MPRLILKQKGKTNNTTKQGVTVYIKNSTPVIKSSGNTMTITTPAKLIKANKK